MLKFAAGMLLLGGFVIPLSVSVWLTAVVGIVELNSPIWSWYESFCQMIWRLSVLSIGLAFCVRGVIRNW